MPGHKSTRDWIGEYGHSHRHPVNRTCHTIGIPMIVISVALAAVALAAPRVWPLAIALFAAGWVLQFVGHYVGQASRVLPRLAISLRGAALVDGQDPRPRVAVTR
jgi:uncharacterized membrane protein YGL010W